MKLQPNDTCWPSTLAGRRLLSGVLSLVEQIAGYNTPENDAIWAKAIIAIEVEARDDIREPELPRRYFAPEHARGSE